MNGRILLVSPGHDGEHAQHKSHRRVHRDPPPLGLLYVGTALQAAGYEVDIIDTHVTPDWNAQIATRLLSRDYLWAGVSVIIGQRQRNAAEVSRLIRQNKPKLPIVWGGTLATVFGADLKDAYPGLCDYVVPGEGEAWAVGFSDSLSGRVERPALNWQYPDWTLLGKGFNREQIPYYHMLMTSRGCPMECTFCYKHTATGGYRLHPLEGVKAQMLAMHERTGTRVFTIGDDNFLGNGERAVQLLRWMQDRGFYFEEAIGHIGQLTEYIAEAMEGVVTTFIFSVESASPRLQRIVKKGVSVGMVPAKMRWLAGHGIVANCSFIFGLPTETVQERIENDMLMQRIRERNSMVRGVSYVYMPLPGTPMLDWIEKELKVPCWWPVKEYEDANFWPEKGDVGGKFRPWMSEAEYQDVCAAAVQFRKDWTFPKPAPYKLAEVLEGKA